MYNRRSPFPLFLLSFSVTLSLLAPTPGRAENVQAQYAPEAISCGAIADELKTIGLQNGPATQPKKRKGLGFLKAFGAAAPLVGFGGGLGGAVASTAANVAQTAAANSAGATAADTAAMNEVLDQRRAQLTALYEAKRCS